MRRQIKHSISTTHRNVSGGHPHNKTQKKKKLVEHEEEEEEEEGEVEEEDEEEEGEDDNNRIGQKKERSNRCSVERRLCGGSSKGKRSW